MSRTNPTMWTQVTAVGLLSAILASGGTYAVVQASQDEQPVVLDAAAATTSANASPAAYSPSTDWGGVAANVSPSVVAISVESNAGGGAGSGVVWDQDGHIVTNAHVVAGAQQVQVTLADGRSYSAEIAGADPSTDLAVLTLTSPPEDLHPITVGDDETLAVGDPVMAIGNPLGLSGTVTTGIISALDRPVTTEQAGAEGMQPGAMAQAEPVVTNAIQTSAAINPGNSGGALVDGSGALIGINSSIASLSSAMGGQAGNIGIGFAIPVNEVSSIAGQLIEDGTAEHAFLGIGLSDATADQDGATLYAAGVTMVEPGSPADGAGLKEGDVVTHIDGERVNGSLALVAQVRQRTAGSEVELTYIRDGETQHVTVTLDVRADS
ncbi:trypsin-like peptidase domain-containing protein [Ornithinimicrobium sp. F0845]|uniref:S1C family serine protease n=1 Tax=Ornithinimicrobium sp. F0845 TaxID=2926412 RepID=UPI001FF11940|nr:trypsin-like peptidase domain-containing protein [Ornithinimicrobium sp. F0845]MCK0110843.1 trypsin-like peptidase domain-containing protein [Ornithinimicrobium sp. F0845]